MSLISVWGIIIIILVAICIGYFLVKKGEKSKENMGTSIRPESQKRDSKGRFLSKKK